ncbi:MAG: outer membrane lipoprotein carrier protein LolA [Betaproteobacteria bacterium]|nr:outer membrane lipoprotein carrier protein LolA [Betaproteobacteria bacterium]
MVSLRPPLDAPGNRAEVKDHRSLRLAAATPLLGLLVFSALAFSTARAADSPPLLTHWLAAQTNLQTWSADVTQTRTLKTLTQPLVARGRLWFAAPNLFRWELGEPAQTIAVRQPGQMLVLYPRLKRAERYPLDPGATGPLRDLLTLIEAGFPRTQAELEARFKVLAVKEAGGVGELRLQPKSPTARKMMPELKIEFRVKDSQPRATELQFADGSTMRNEFTNAVLNAPLADALFQPAVPEDFKVTEPMRGGTK